MVELGGQLADEKKRISNHCQSEADAKQERMKNTLARPPVFLFSLFDPIHDGDRL
jgi:hypothetical protein